MALQVYQRLTKNDVEWSILYLKITKRHCCIFLFLKKWTKLLCTRLSLKINTWNLSWKKINFWAESHVFSSNCKNQAKTMCSHTTRPRTTILSLAFPSLPIYPSINATDWRAATQTYRLSITLSLSLLSIRGQI